MKPFWNFGVWQRGLLLCCTLLLLAAPDSLGLDELEGRLPAVTAVAGSAAPAERVAEDLAYLASDALEGRGVGTAGIDKAADYLAESFASMGLETALFDEGPKQRVRVPTVVDIDPEKENSARVSYPDGTTEEWKLNHDFNPLGLGESGKVKGEVIFAGYGITAKNRNYDDYAEIDAKDKVVLVLRKEPESWRTSRRPSKHAYFSTKMANALAHDAAGLIIVNDRITTSAARQEAITNFVRAVESMPKVEAAMLESDAEASVTRRAVRAAVDNIRAAELQLDDRFDVPISTTGAGRATGGKSVPAISITREAADQLLARGGLESLAEIEEQIKETETPRSALIEGAEVEFVTGLSEGFAESFNVFATLPGAGDLADEIVFVGAHYDHVGMGGRGSLAPGTIAVHNGADDNASGTAALLEVARRISAAPADGPRRRIVFAAFTGEESGLIGSKHYIRSPRFPLEQTVAMVNMDMVGRLQENQLTLFGTGTAPGFDGLIDSLNKKYRFEIERQETGNGPSDHQSFYNAKIPVLHFFTGLHNDYHRPGDDFEKINVTGLVRITDIVTDVVTRLATQPERPEYAQADGTSVIRYQSQPYVGIMTEDVPGGLQVTDVIADSPAEVAGLRAGDMIVRIDLTEISNLQSLREHLSTRRVGEAVELLILRGEEELQLELELGKRE